MALKKSYFRTSFIFTEKKIIFLFLCNICNEVYENYNEIIIR